LCIWHRKALIMHCKGFLLYVPFTCIQGNCMIPLWLYKTWQFTLQAITILSNQALSTIRITMQRYDIQITINYEPKTSWGLLRFVNAKVKNVKFLRIFTQLSSQVICVSKNDTNTLPLHLYFHVTQATVTKTVIGLDGDRVRR
jgi:hypothetical protein